MSYDVWMDIDTGGPERAEVCDVGNYTSNLSPLWAWAIDQGEVLSRWLDGRSGDEALPVLDAALARIESATDLSEYEPPNGWGSVEGGTEYLRRIRDAAAAHPRAQFRVSA